MKCGIFASDKTNKKMKDYLIHFTRKWNLDDKLLWKRSAEKQASFVRSTVCGNLLNVPGFVVSTHYSKSCELPVYFIRMRNGIEVTMRGNFYDWKVSVVIPEGYAGLPAGIIPEDCLSYRMVENPGEKIPSCYCEGFKEEWCYDGYNPDSPGRKFTIEIPDEERLYVILHVLKHAYPDVVFDEKSDTRDTDELKRSIEDIFSAHGYDETEESVSFGISGERRLVSGWEILWRTHKKIENLRYESIPDDCRITENSPEEYAKVINMFPEVHREFLMEEWLFS